MPPILDECFDNGSRLVRSPSDESPRAQVHAYRDPDGYRRVWFWATGNLGSAVLVPDGPEHNSFCRGEMPPAVYADWLEENGVQMPRECYDLLRGWATEV